MIGLEYLAESLGLKYKDIAEMLKISPKTINDWVKGRRKIPELRMVELEIIFGVPSHYFQIEINKEDKLEVEKYLLEYRNNKIIEQLEEIKNDPYKEFGVNESKNLITSLYNKIVLDGYDLPIQTSLIIKLLYFLIDHEYTDTVSVLWDALDILEVNEGVYIDDLKKLNTKYIT